MGAITKIITLTTYLNLQRAQQKTLSLKSGRPYGCPGAAEHVDQWLENYLISNKNSLERAKEGLDCYFSVRVLVPEVFTMRDPLLEAVQKSFEVMGVIILPKLTPEGRRVILFSHLTPSAEDFDATVMLKRISMMMDLMLQEGVDYVGIDVVVDSKHVVFSHLARYNLSILRKTFDLGWDLLINLVLKGPLRCLRNDRIFWMSEVGRRDRLLSRSMRKNLEHNLSYVSSEEGEASSESTSSLKAGRQGVARPCV
ncbi:hypothetical protein J6590_067800 [Homalodisca vitripennis]|nr:hypothetical protein J6590_067800 [Homalodisca vitripennis]